MREQNNNNNIFLKSVCVCVFYLLLNFIFVLKKNRTKQKRSNFSILNFNKWKNNECCRFVLVFFFFFLLEKWVSFLLGRLVGGNKHGKHYIMRWIKNIIDNNNNYYYYYYTRKRIRIEAYLFCLIKKKKEENFVVSK